VLSGHQAVIAWDGPDRDWARRDATIEMAEATETTRITVRRPPARPNREPWPARLAAGLGGYSTLAASGWPLLGRTRRHG
jgi:hypothetical protein